MSGYYLHQGTSLEQFPKQSSELFLQDDPLSAPVYIVVQNRGLGEWLVRSLARNTGSIMGPRILMPEQALRRFAGGYPTARKMVSPDKEDPGVADSTLAKGEGKGLLFMDSMKLAVYKAVEEAIAGEDDLYKDLRRYARSGGKRLWQLADALAGIFYHYGMNCLPLVQAWDAGAFYPGLSPQLREAEAWQRGLWNRIFHEGSPYTHLSRILSETMASGESFDGKQARVVLFGSMFLGETGLRFFRYLAESLEVHHFLFTPVRPDSAVSTPVTVPFLRENGRLSSDFTALIPGLSPEQVNWSAGEGTPQNLLENLRTALIEARRFDSPFEDDGSLEIHDVPGIRRQVEVLKDRILAALRDDATLAPTDICVLAPDISAYAPYVETLFPGVDTSGRDSLPYNLSDLPSRSEAPYPGAFSQLLELPGSRFGRSSLTALFENPCFAPTARSPELADIWRKMAENLQVRWGVDSGHRTESGAADPGTGSWERAFERLLAGSYHDEGDDTELLPADLGGNTDAEAAGLLMRCIHLLDWQLRTADRETKTLREWTLEWERILDTWLKPRKDDSDDESDRLRIKGSIRDLMALDEDLAGLSDFSDQGIPWSAFSALLKEMANAGGARRGRYLSRGITCASLKPMRAIPFRRIYILGLDEGVWPGREYLTGFDLREEVEKSIDLSRESVDRFAFLETLFAASDHISFIYSGRDAERGEPSSPASPLAELCEYIGTGWERLLRVHPLAPYSVKALGGDVRLASSSSNALALAESRKRGPSPAAAADPGLADKALNETIDWRELLGFLSNPIQYYYRDVLGVSGESVVGNEEEHDVLEPGFLDWWQWKNDSVLFNPENLEDAVKLTDSFRNRLSLEGAVADTAIAGLGTADLLSDAEALSRQYRRIVSEGFEAKGQFSVILDPVINSPEGDSTPGGILRLPSPRIQTDDGTSLTITGRIPGIGLMDTGGRSTSVSWTILEFVHGKQIKVRHQLQAWLKALLLGASTDRSGLKELRVFRVGSREFPARRYYFDAEAMPREIAGDLRLLDRPEERLQELSEIRREGRRLPLLLHPDLAEALWKTEKKTGVILSDNLPEVAQENWDKLLDGREFSKLQGCSYRNRFVHLPSFGNSLFLKTWQSLYREGGIL